jgi:hypothetical protein
MQVSLNAILLKIQGRFLILALVTAELHTLAGSCYFLGPLNQPVSLVFPRPRHLFAMGGLQAIPRDI